MKPLGFHRGSTKLLYKEMLPGFISLTQQIRFLDSLSLEGSLCGKKKEEGKNGVLFVLFLRNVILPE